MPIFGSVASDQDWFTKSLPIGKPQTVVICGARCELPTARAPCANLGRGGVDPKTMLGDFGEEIGIAPRHGEVGERA
jgi:hypothetical protein